jgi:hypothetical protein
MDLRLGEEQDAGGAYGERSFIICTLRQTEFELKKDEMGGACTMQGR